MPKPLSIKERDEIQNKLIAAAEDCLARYGLKKTTVDELVKRVNIPKGTFYLFYASKELLFFDVFLNFHEKTHKRLLEAIDAMAEANAENVSALIFDIYKQLEGSFMYRFMMGGELELLFRKLPQDVLDRHNERDDLSVRQLVSLVPGIKEADVETYSAALRALFTSMMFRREIGEAVFDKALMVLIRGVVIQMFQGAER